MLWKKRIEGGPDAAATLARRVDDIESALRRLQVEWADTLDRVTRMAGRVAKRAERAAAREDEQDDAPAGFTNGASEAMRIVEKRRSRAWPGGGRP